MVENVAETGNEGEILKEKILFDTEQLELWWQNKLKESTHPKNI